MESLPNGRASIGLRSCELSAVTKVVGHVLVASACFFCLQLFVLGQSFETSVIWAIAGGGGAALLSWLQQRRGG